MASSQSLSHQIPLLRYFPHSPLKPHTFSPKLSLKNPRFSLGTLSFSAPKAAPATQEDILKAIADSGENTLPCVRTYENDLSRLTLVGAVDFQQALTAAAADGGQSAAEHVDSGMPAMVVETVFPGGSDEHGTISTRLFLPARKVEEKARKLRRSITEDILSSTTSRNILAMTFRQVVMKQLWNFELVIFSPGSERNMEDLDKPREVTVSFTLSSSDEQVISMLAEAACISALQSTEKQFLDNGKSLGTFFHRFRKPRRSASKDSSVIIYKLFEDEMIENAKSLLENFKSTKQKFNLVKRRSKYNWWSPSAHSKLEKIGGPEFSSWTSEYIPAYRLQMDAGKLKSLKFEGWRNSGRSMKEVLLTHSQMVGLADILDMFYEDICSLPDKQLSCGLTASSANLSSKKREFSLLKFLSVTLASGIFLVAVSALGQLCLPHLSKGEKYLGDQRSLPLSSEVDYAQHQSLDAEKLEEFCVSIVKKLKDAYGWPGDVCTETTIGTWTGKLPDYFRIMDQVDYDREGVSSGTVSSEKIGEEMKASTQGIASYQVVLSADGKIVGFQPTSRVAVLYWAANPLTKELYGGKKLSPGLLEPGLNVPQPNSVVLIELLMSVRPDSCFALARPVR